MKKKDVKIVSVGYIPNKHTLHISLPMFELFCLFFFTFFFRLLEPSHPAFITWYSLLSLSNVSFTITVNSPKCLYIQILILRKFQISRTKCLQNIKKYHFLVNQPWIWIYLCTLIGNFKGKYKPPFVLCFVISNLTFAVCFVLLSKVQSYLCTFIANYKGKFVLFIKVLRAFVLPPKVQTSPLYFYKKVQTCLCSFLWKCKAKYKGGLYFALKLPIKVQRVFALSFEITNQSTKVNHQTFEILDKKYSKSPWIFVESMLLWCMFSTMLPWKHLYNNFRINPAWSWVTITLE